VLDPRTGEARSLRLPGEEIENSFALAPGGGAYVVSSRELAFLRIGPAGAPRVAWSQAYDRGTRQKPGQTSRGSGTTPTVMLGGRFVAIADNAEPRMNVQVYDTRPGIRGSRLVCETPVFEAGESASENSLIVAGASIFVENNYGYSVFDSLGGHVPEPGAARVDFDPSRRSCELAWENDEVHIPSVVSKLAAADGTMLTYTKEPYATGIEAWWFTALDAGTGEVLWRRLAGTGPMANNHYAALYLGPTGNLYVGTIDGVIALTRP
jgi:outer membrane protein assembly factor BamB